MKEELEFRSMSVADLERNAGIKPGNLGRMLHGQFALSWAVMIAVARALDKIEFLPAPASFDDLEPPKE